MKEISIIIDEFVKKNNLEDSYNLVKIINIWQENFPKTIIENVKVVDFNSGIIEFHVTSSAWNKEVLLRKREIIDKINSLLPIKHVHDIKVMQH